MAAGLDLLNVRAVHQSLRHLVAKADWSDAELLCRVCDSRPCAISSAWRTPQHCRNVRAAGFERSIYACSTVGLEAGIMKGFYMQSFRRNAHAAQQARGRIDGVRRSKDVSAKSAETTEVVGNDVG